jgi:glucose dehydrogenase
LIFTLFYFFGFLCNTASLFRKPFYEMDKGTDSGVKTWNPDGWKIGGGNVRGWISYDAELNLIFYGTGNAGPRIK